MRIPRGSVAFDELAKQQDYYAEEDQVDRRGEASLSHSANSVRSVRRNIVLKTLDSFRDFFLRCSKHIVGGPAAEAASRV